MKKNFMLFIMLLLLTGCASQPHFDIRDQMGRQMPYPSYSVSSTEYPMSVTFYYAKLRKDHDIDQSILLEPEYLNMFRFHDIDSEKYPQIIVAIEIFNPQELPYLIEESNELQIGPMRYEAKSGSILNVSNKKYRNYMYNLPVGDNIRMVDNLITIKVEHNEVFRIGNFRYNLIQ